MILLAVNFPRSNYFFHHQPRGLCFSVWQELLHVLKSIVLLPTEQIVFIGYHLVREHESLQVAFAACIQRPVYTVLGTAKLIIVGRQRSAG